MRPVPKVDFFQVKLIEIGLKLPEVAQKSEYIDPTTVHFSLASAPIAFVVQWTEEKV